MWHKLCRTFHPWCPCIKTRCLSPFYLYQQIQWRNSCKSRPSVVQPLTCSTYAKNVNTFRPRQNGLSFCRHFLEWERLKFDLNFTENCSERSIWQYANIGSDNGLVPNRRQAIIWTSDVSFTVAYMRCSASLSYGVDKDRDHSYH